MFSLPPGVRSMVLALPWGGTLWICGDDDVSPLELLGHRLDYRLDVSRTDGAALTMRSARDKREAFGILVSMGVVRKVSA